MKTQPGLFGKGKGRFRFSAWVALIILSTVCRAWADNSVPSVSYESKAAPPPSFAKPIEGRVSSADVPRASSQETTIEFLSQKEGPIVKGPIVICAMGPGCDGNPPPLIPFPDSPSLKIERRIPPFDPLGEVKTVDRGHLDSLPGIEFREKFTVKPQMEIPDLKVPKPAEPKPSFFSGNAAAAFSSNRSGHATPEAGITTGNLNDVIPEIPENVEPLPSGSFPKPIILPPDLIPPGTRRIPGTEPKIDLPSISDVPVATPLERKRIDPKLLEPPPSLRARQVKVKVGIQLPPRLQLFVPVKKESFKGNAAMGSAVIKSSPVAKKDTAQKSVTSKRNVRAPKIKRSPGHLRGQSLRSIIRSLGFREKQRSRF